LDKIYRIRLDHDHVNPQLCKPSPADIMSMGRRKVKHCCDAIKQWCWLIFIHKIHLEWGLFFSLYHLWMIWWIIYIKRFIDAITGNGFQLVFSCKTRRWENENNFSR